MGLEPQFTADLEERKSLTKLKAAWCSLTPLSNLILHTPQEESAKADMADSVELKV